MSWTARRLTATAAGYDGRGSSRPRREPQRSGTRRGRSADSSRPATGSRTLQATGTSREMRLIEEALSAGRDVVDTTSPSPQVWAPLLDVARAHEARTAAYWLPPDLAGSLRGNAAGRIGPGFLRSDCATPARLRRPRVQDGFDEVFVVEFDLRCRRLVRPGNVDAEEQAPPACPWPRRPRARPGKPRRDVRSARAGTPCGPSPAPPGVRTTSAYLVTGENIDTRSTL